MKFPEEQEVKHLCWDKGYGCQSVLCGAVVSVFYKGSAFGRIRSFHYVEQDNYIGQVESCADNNELKIQKGDFVSFKAENVQGLPDVTNLINGGIYVIEPIAKVEF